MLNLQLFNDSINNRDALICHKCIGVLNAHIVFQQKVRKIDEIYFKPLRNKKSSSNSQNLLESKSPDGLLFPVHNDSIDTDNSDTILSDSTEGLGLKIKNVHSLR